MRVTLGTFVLCGGEADNEFPAGLSIDDEPVVDVVPYLRAAAAVPLARQNWSMKIDLTVEREHASHRVACEFAGLHRMTMPTTGDIILQFEGEGVTRCKLVNGIRGPIKCPDITGCSTIHRYTLLGSYLEAVST